MLSYFFFFFIDLQFLYLYFRNFLFQMQRKGIKKSKKPAPSIEAIYSIKNKFPTEGDYIDTFSYLLIALSAFGLLRFNPSYCWISIFVNFSFHINTRKGKLKLDVLFDHHIGMNF